jgi:hypothetical protein
MSNILQNALYFPEHDYYMPSTHVHDYREFEYLPGHIAILDGGKEYLRRSVIPPEHSDLVIPWGLTRESPKEDILNKLLWGSLPLDKTLPQVHVYRPIALLTKEHLQAILDNVPKISPLHRQVIEYWLTQKSENS